MYFGQDLLATFYVEELDAIPYKLDRRCMKLNVICKRFNFIKVLTMSVVSSSDHVSCVSCVSPRFS